MNNTPDGNAENKSEKNLLEKFLSLFTEVKPGEAGTALLLTLNIFLVLASYYIAKVVREGLILSEFGAIVKSYSSAFQTVLIGAVVIPVYSWLAARLDRKKLINYVTLFFVLCFVLFYFMAVAKLTLLGVIYFVWVGIFSLVVISLFWAFANDLYSTEKGERLFVIVAFGASAGAVAGSYIAGKIVTAIGNAQMLLLAAAILVIAMLISNLVDRRESRAAARRTSAARSAEAKESISKGDAFKLIFKRRYLLLIALLVLLLNWVNTNGEFILGDVVVTAANKATAMLDGTEAGIKEARGIYISEFYGDFFFWVNLAGFILQLFFVSRIIKYLGVRIAVLILPFLALASYSLIAIAPIFSLIRWAKTAENATDYSLNNTVRQMLFLPTTREEKYKAKVAIDSFFQRAGDVLSAVVVFVVADWLMKGVTEVAIVNLALVVVWLWIAYLVGKKYFEKTAEKQPSEAGGFGS